ncbi:MAG: class I SAM-dependent methyltransferase [Phycisphaerales bacterium]|nr:class I SAM-dependent methyltransferase [Phycisphaerales bacterium]
MDDREVARLWEDNAETWTQLARCGCDVYRDFVNTPGFFAILPDVDGLHGLDIGCGEGHNTRLLARRGAIMTAIDIAPTFVRHARELESEQPLGITYKVADARRLPFDDSSFGFATAFMSLMDMTRPNEALAEAYRVLRPGGFLQFSITHPCFMASRWKWVLNDAGERIGAICGDYHFPKQGQVDTWFFSVLSEEERRSHKPFRVPRFPQTLSSWVNTMIDTGFIIEQLGEPTVDEDTARRHPEVADTRIIAYFLHVRCRKPVYREADT